MTVHHRAISIIKRSEGVRFEPYICAGGKLTIGYGHTGPDVEPGMTIDQAQADALLTLDLQKFDLGVAKVCPLTSPLQHGAMVSLAFNIGLGSFGKSSVARLHNAGKYGEAAQSFALWNKAAGKVLPGLVKRRAEEAALYVEGTEQPGILSAPEKVTAEGELPLTKSKTMIGSGVGIAAMGASSLGDVVQQISWAKQLIEPLLPYAPQISTGLIVVGLIGIGVALWARWQDRRQGRS